MTGQVSAQRNVRLPSPFLPWMLLLTGLLLGPACSKSTAPKDGTPPAAVRDLKVLAVADSSVTLSWTATGDDGSTGTASLYDLRRATSPLSDQDWTSGTPIERLPAPAPAGARETFIVRGLPPGVKQYFALRVADEVPFWSLMSNQVSAVPGQPLCRLTPDSLAFGTVAPGASFDVPLLIENAGGGTLTGQVVASCTGFTILSGSAPFTLRAGESVRAIIRFAPASTGRVLCRLQTGTLCGEVPCSGMGMNLPLLLNPVLTDSARFEMGSAAVEPGHENDEARHPVVLTVPFRVGTREIVQSEWISLMGWNDSGFPGADRPVENITWFDAVDFCNRLSARDGFDAAYSLGAVVQSGVHIVQAGVVWNRRADGYRLPTEAEWEYACRAGSAAAFSDGPMSDPLCSDPLLARVAWYCGNARESTRPVQTREANAFGLSDMHGNVREWCWDIYHRTYGQILEEPGDTLGTQRDPAGPDSGESRVARGGGWLSQAHECRSAFRIYHQPKDQFNDLGLRVVRTVR